MIEPRIYRAAFIPAVIAAMHEAIDSVGAGSGGTRKCSTRDRDGPPRGRAPAVAGRVAPVRGGTRRRTTLATATVDAAKQVGELVEGADVDAVERDLAAVAADLGVGVTLRAAETDEL